MSEKKNVFLAVFEWIVNCYNNSIFERLAAGFFGFFKKNAPNSCVVRLFKRGGGDLWKSSISAKIVRSPFYVCRAFYKKNEQRTELVKSRSGAYEFFKNASHISLRDFGEVLLCFATGTAVGNTVFSKWSNLPSLAAVGIFLAAGLYLCLCNMSASQVKSGSVLVRMVKKTVFCSDDFAENNTAVMPLKNKKYLCCTAFAAGAVLLSKMPIGTLCGIAAAVMLTLILYKPKIGVFVFVPLAAILPTMVLAGIVGLTFVSFVLHLLFGKHAEYVSTPMQPCIAVFLGMAAYAAITSADFSGSLKIFMIYFIFTLAYVLVVNNIRSRSDWTALVALAVFAAALVALYGIYQNFFMASTAQGWVDETMFSDIKKRVYSTLDNPNVLGEYFILMMPIAFAIFVKVKGGLRKAAYGICCALMFTCLMYTWSRGAWLGVMIGIGFFVLLKDRRWLILCVAGVLLMPSVLPESIITRFTSIGNMKDSSTAYRVAVWIGSVRMLRDYWFSGIGLGSGAFLKIYPQYALGGADFALHSHNFYLQWIVDMGFMGIIVYFWIIITGFKQIGSSKEKNSIVKNVLLAMSGAMMGYLFHGMAENLWYNYRMILVFWIFFAVLTSGAAISSDKTSEDIIS